MIVGLIVETLVEIGLIRGDYKHRKRVRAKEKEDGFKRPMQKIFFSPSIILLVIVITSVTGVHLYIRHKKVSAFPEDTKMEIAEISKRVEKWNNKYGKYPTELNEVIGNNPIRRTWKNDAWKRLYKYTVKENGTHFLIVSAGSDGRFETEDDIKSE